MKSWIVSVGDEVLSGKVVNTNFAKIAMYFNKIGVEVDKGLTIGDDKQDIINVTNKFMESDADIMITTGGLGPTHDDFTKEVISEALGLKLVYNEEASQDMFNYFKEKKNDCNVKQEYYPEGCIIINNPIGSADGFIIEKDNKTIISLVGVPIEMEAMMKSSVCKYLENKGHVKLNKEFMIMGDTESSIENRLIPFMKEHPFVTICPYCDQGRIRYQLTANKEHEKEFNKTVNDFINFMGNLIVADREVDIEEIVVNELKNKGYHISCAESVTGGMLVSTIINVSGASDIVEESYVTYSNNVKNKLLGVSFDTIEKYDVVSEPVVIEMVNGLYDRTKSEVCVSVSGYAGPGDNAGLVCYCIKINDKVKAYTHKFRGSRNIVRLRAVRRILYDLHILLKEEENENE